MRTMPRWRTWTATCCSLVTKNRSLAPVWTARSTSASTAWLTGSLLTSSNWGLFSFTVWGPLGSASALLRVDSATTRRLDGRRAGRDQATLGFRGFRAGAAASGVAGAWESSDASDAIEGAAESARSNGATSAERSALAAGGLAVRGGFGAALGFGDAAG